jgi:hypothetical protein
LLAEGELLAVRAGEVLDGRARNFDNHQQDRKLSPVHQSQKSLEML